MSDENDDEALWRRACDGDGAAFAALFRRHRERVYRRALTLVGSVHDAEDVTAAAFFELWRRQRAVRIVDGSVMPWLVATAVNLARNNRRGDRRHRRLLATLPRSEAPDAASIALANVEAELLGVRLTDALSRVSAADATLLVLTALDGLSVAAAAGVLGVSPGAARMRLRRARQRLQADLAEERHPHPILIPDGEHA